ncbi:MAG: sugar phosphate isomerase/epimerase [Acetatifactor sp.]|nr:sugar phosphate isomerase/epimerase [Acetatifactor sp.]
MRKLCIASWTGYDITDIEALPLIAEAGFDGFFPDWEPEKDMNKIAAVAKDCGLFLQSVHGPFGNMDKMWEPGAEGDAAARELIECLRVCEKIGAPIMVAHAIIGMDKHEPNDIGVERFALVAREAERVGVMLALENVEGIEYLLKLRDTIGDMPSVRYCWDSGHEMCYNGSMDVPALYNGKLICTHLNDNCGQTDPAMVTWHDDSHMMPFDGKADWRGIADRLNREKYEGPLTFELTCLNKPGRHTHEIYSTLSPAEFFKKAYDKAVEVEKLVER